jgi:DNA-binding NarL/FixJ family response regulator
LVAIRLLAASLAEGGYGRRPTSLERGERLLSDGTEHEIRVMVVDDQRLFTRGLSGLLELLPGVEVVGVAYDGEEAVALCREREPDVVLMDISMPKMDGISATREIKDLLPQTAIIILTGHEEDEHVFEGIKAGAQGYLLKDSEPEDLSRAIHTVYAGNTIIAPDLAQKMLNTFERGRQASNARLAPPPLTERELEVIKALARGMSDRQIARSLSISEKTVRNHASNIYRKLHIFDRTQAVIYAVREGVIDVEELEYRPPREP